MQASSTTPVYTDFTGIAKLRAEAHQDPQGSLREVARQFEGLYLQMMLKSMREASFGDPLFDSSSGDMYRDMFDKQLTLQMTQGKGLGLAELMVQQLRRQSAAADSSARRQTFAATTTPPSLRLTSQEEFRRELLPAAQTAAKQLGTTPEVLLAQAALETGWGQHTPRCADGSNSHNLFNIKADASWKGKQAEVDTVEYQHAVALRQHASFRAYGSYAEAFTDYAKFIQSNPRYIQALAHADDADHYIQHIHAAGYATDPDYAAKWRRVLQERFAPDKPAVVSVDG
ncbi:MAG: flagellar assembly peptidoglycan hydrolase FlgJ [Gammaproteobacteria bacterium]|nr:flagellar assembly peptidoglycan hydrolase FlgJ [Gammaproteobacteria bacterium]